MPKLDWIIEIIGNGVVCSKCGQVEDSFPEYICNAHTHGMKKYHHPDFQLVLHISDADIGYILNSLGLRVRSGEQFKAGDLVEGIFEDCPVRLDSFQETGREVLRVIIPDSQNRFPEDPNCDYPYSFQLVPTNMLEQSEGGVC